MRRADRYLRILQILRRSRRPVDAARIAAELEVSVRTIYRDIAGMQANNVPVRGAAGVGYVLGEGFDLPPLMFTIDELEAILVGMRWVEARADAGLRRAAKDVLGKVGAVLPEHLRPVLNASGLATPRYSSGPPEETIDVADVRRAIRETRKLCLAYVDEKGIRSTRVIWPIALAYFDAARIIVAWCEMREGFRHFRTDRITTAHIERQRYPRSRAALIRQWQKEQAANEGGADCPATVANDARVAAPANGVRCTVTRGQTRNAN